MEKDLLFKAEYFMEETPAWQLNVVAVCACVCVARINNRRERERHFIFSLQE